MRHRTGLAGAPWGADPQLAARSGMHSHAELIERFYACFEKRDGAGMAQCYHANIVFSDPVFPLLRGPQAGAMWRMLCAQAREFTLSVSGIQADETDGKAHWEARYLFGATGRRVHNKIDARFQFQDGRIIRHIDHFNFWRWSRMALGPTGLLLGWSPMVKNKVRRQAAKSLARYREQMEA